jgi:hypothetical protein
MRYRLVPIGFLPVLWAAEEIRFAFAWMAFLLREHQRARHAQRVREFIALAESCRARAQNGNPGLSLPR